MRISHLFKAVLVTLGIISLAACCTTAKQPHAAVVAPAAHVYYFDFNQSKIRPEYTAKLQREGRRLANHSNASVQVIGHADSRGSNQYNYQLAMNRAKAVATELEKYGARPDQIHVISRGESDPAVVGTTDRAYQLNRRVDVIAS